jgi:hypothetical protein
MISAGHFSLPLFQPRFARLKAAPNAGYVPGALGWPFSTANKMIKMKKMDPTGIIQDLYPVDWPQDKEKPATTD